MSASTAIRAPAIGLEARSANLRVTVVTPTRGGSGEISCSIATEASGSTRLEQPPMSSSRKPDESYENLTCFRQPTKAQPDFPSLKPLLLKRDVPIRRCRPDFPAHSQVETYGSTFRSPWG